MSVRNSMEMETEYARLSMEIDRARQAKADATKIEQAMDLLDAGEVHRKLVAAVKEIEKYEDQLVTRTTTLKSLLRKQLREEESRALLRKTIANGYMDG